MIPITKGALNIYEKILHQADIYPFSEVSIYLEILGSQKNITYQLSL